MDGRNKIYNNLNDLFDRYSGKEKLEEEIDRLQSHIVELEIDIKRITKNEDTTRHALSAKQEAEEKLNAANTRMETLEHEVDRLKEENAEEISFRYIENIPPRMIRSYLSQIASLRTDHDSLITAYVPAEQSINEMKDSDRMLEYIDTADQNLIKKIGNDTGYVLFYDTARMICEVATPPLPITRSSWEFNDRFDVSDLQTLTEMDLNICIVAAHAGQSLVGITHNRHEFTNYQIVQSSVKAKHTKGGFSQRRFERLRDEDIAHHTDKVRKTLTTMLFNTDESIDYLIMCGDVMLGRHVLDAMQLDTVVIERNVEGRIEKHNIDTLLKSLFSCRRYKL
ncbi:MAG: Vms1/Ankzf1 family peptidyl-tRNA hydrolase [Euryarchaeota archaeon]|nr:Vms1/Ankzf1 family peptidyl-tRNA hydrolase [Euryarchaeota archaeon]